MKPRCVDAVEKQMKQGVTEIHLDETLYGELVDYCRSFIQSAPFRYDPGLPQTREEQFREYEKAMRETPMLLTYLGLPVRKLKET